MRRPMLSIDLEAESLLRACLSAGKGVEGWNDLMKELHDIHLAGQVWDGEAAEPMIILGLLMEGADLSGLSLPGINLSAVYMEKCRLENCDLRGASLAICPGCSFRGSDLRGASFTSFADLTAADFSGAVMDDATVVERGLFDDGHPPIGLPARLLECCHPDPAETREPLGRTRVLPVKVRASLYMPGRS